MKVIHCRLSLTSVGCVASPLQWDRIKFILAFYPKFRSEMAQKFVVWLSVHKHNEHYKRNVQTPP